MVESFAHGKPFWWYVAILPGLVLPWLFWPSLLRGLWRLIRPSPARAGRAADAGLRLIVVWGVASLVIFSLISGKRPHYLIPLFPALALGAALLLARLGGGAGRIGPRPDMAPPVILLLTVAGVIAALPHLAPALGYAKLGAGGTTVWVLPLIAGVLAFLWRPPRALAQRGAALALLSMLAVAGMQGAAEGNLSEAYDVRPLARHLARLQENGRPIAHYGKYHGQYNFLGRLKRPLAITGDAEVVRWIKQNPRGKIVSYHRQLPKGARPDFAQRFRNRVVAVWDGAAVLADPNIARRGAE
jgi:4-amino-4-deoxy-L-arabinose transferase-like glycosyltransferase